ncbi:hypothetical protein EI94DRAFT_1712890 [Lactarius quietus]|nr:hypothetical protein EI94DRAFT_1712890 [Lactarius quietus]
MTTPAMSTSWIETQYDPRLNPPYHYEADNPYHYDADHPDGGMLEADHAPSRQTSYSVTPHHSIRHTFNSGLYGPRPLHRPVDHMYGMQAQTMVAMTEPEPDDADADAENMELDPDTDQGPIYDSQYDDLPQSHGTRRFVGGFIRGLKKIPRAMKRGFRPDRRTPHTPPSIPYQFQSPYYASGGLNAGMEELSGNPPYDAATEEGDQRYSEDPNVPPELSPTEGPSRSMSQAIRAPRTESQPTYQSLTYPSSQHHSHHGSLHEPQRSSPRRTVRNPDPASTAEEGSEIRQSFTHWASPISPREREPARRPTVTIQGPTGSPVYIEPELADDYAGMGTDIEHHPEPSGHSQITRIGKFFRDLNNLPWVSSNVTVDFKPEDSGRARHSHSRGTGRSWYTGQLHDLDVLGGGAADSSTRRLTAPSGHSLAHAPGSSATLAPAHGSGSASSSEGPSTHLPAQHAAPSYGLPPSLYPPYAMPQVQMPSQPVYFIPATYPGGMQPQPTPPRGPGPGPNLADQASPQSSGNSEPGVPRQPYFYVVMPPGYVGGPVDPLRPMMQMQYGAVPYPPA